MRLSANLLLLGFLFFLVPVQSMAQSYGYTCGIPFPTYSFGVCTGSVHGCPDGTNVVNCTGGICNGTDGNDCMIGSSNDDIINAGKGDDWICGYGGADWVKASYGSDVACGGDGDDVMEGGWGVDDMNGEHGNDALDGGQCNDLLFGGADSGDVCRGGQGADFIDNVDYSCETAIQGPPASQGGTNCPTIYPPAPG